MTSLALCTAPILILILTPFLLCPDSATSSLRFFDYVQSTPTTLLSVSPTLLLRPTSSYCVHPFFQGRSKTVAECEEGITHYCVDPIFQGRSKNVAECEEGITHYCVDPIFQGRRKNVAECEEDITASIQFFKDVGRTLLSVKRILLRRSNFSRT